MVSVVVNQLYDFSSTSSISANYQVYGKYETQIFGVNQAYYKEGNTCFDLSLNNSMEYKVDKRIYYKLSYVNDDSESIPIDDGYWEKKTVCTPSIDDAFVYTFEGYYVHDKEELIDDQSADFAVIIDANDIVEYDDLMDILEPDKSEEEMTREIIYLDKTVFNENTLAFYPTEFESDLTLLVDATATEKYEYFYNKAYELQSQYDVQYELWIAKGLTDEEISVVMNEDLSYTGLGMYEIYIKKIDALNVMADNRIQTNISELENSNSGNLDTYNEIKGGLSDIERYRYLENLN